MKITFSKVTAALCVLMALSCLIVYSCCAPFSMAKPLNKAKKDLVENKELLVSLEENEKSTRAEYEAYVTESEAKIKEYESALSKAEEALEEICDNSYFSTSWYSDCRDNDYECESLHDAVDDAEDALYNYQSEASSTISSYEDTLYNLELTISATQSNIKSLEKTIETLSAALVRAIFVCIGTLISLAALAVLAVYLFTERGAKVLGIAACGAGAVGAAILMFAQKAGFIPHVWTLLIYAMFAVIVLGTSKGKLVASRVVAVVAAVLGAVTAFLSVGTFFTYPHYAILMILVAFVLVPVDFKEYINVALHIFLTFITGGIWLFVWIYNVTANLNKVNSLEKRNPTCQLLLCIFLPVYFSYWLYKNAEYVEAYGDENGKPVNKIAILCFIIGFFCPLLSTILMQDKINQIVGRPQPCEEEPELDDAVTE